MPWSKEQESAISSRGKNLLVAAAAGSGKTAVLVERIIRRLVDGNLDISELLVVTFTNAAAAEMRQRIRQALEQAINATAAAKTSKLLYRLQRQLLLLDNASISTVHAFCRTIISRYFHHLDLDPKFRLAGEQEIKLLQHDTLAQVIEASYELPDNDDFLYFADAYGSESGDQKLSEIILQVYNCAIAQPFPEQWLDSLSTRFAPAAPTLEQSAWGKKAFGQIETILQKCFAYNDLMERTAATYGCTFAAIESDRNFLETLQQLVHADWQKAYQLLQQKTLFVRWDKSDLDEVAKTYLKDELRGKIKKSIEDLQKTYFAMEPATFLADLQQQIPHIICISQLTKQFMEQFAAAKQERQIVDYNDLEHFALKILAQPASTSQALEPTQAALRLQRTYREIMVDEYQDTNGVQEAIIKLIAGNTPKTFFVGDVKQGIYRFRAADPSLFLAKYENYPHLGENYQRIDLAKNFRSRANILKGINFLFAQLWQKDISELDYGDDAALVCGYPYPTAANTLDDSIELCLTTAAEDAATPDEEALVGIAGEGAFIAQRIKELFREQRQVFDKDSKSYRPLHYRDIVILLRSVQGRSEILLDILRQNDIPAYGPLRDGYFTATEIKLLLALLRTIDNPHQDIELAAVLLAPFTGFSPDELATIRLQADGDLCTALQNTALRDDALGQKSAAFLQRLASWRTFARRKSVPELLHQLYLDTGYYDYCGGMPGGLLRQANLRMLIDRAYAYEQTNYRGLFRFLQFIGKMLKAGTDLAAARTLGANEDVVRIMTIHASKGLEFPVVFLAGTGSHFNLRDLTQPLLIHKDYGLAPYIYDIDYNVRYPTFARHVIKNKLRQEALSEELRVLYVALTRAREKLIITATVRDLEKATATWSLCSNHTGQLLPSYTILEAQCYLDWLGNALARHPAFAQLLKQTPAPQDALRDGDAAWQVTNFAGTVKSAQAQEIQQEIFQKIATRQPLPKTTAAQQIDLQLSYRYPHQLDTQIPAKLTVTEIKERLENDNPTDYAQQLFHDDRYEQPQFLQSTTLTGAQYGTLMHRAMQHLDPQNSIDMPSIKKQLQALIKCHIFSDDEVKRLNVAALASFFQSPVGKQLQAAPFVRHELPFSRLIDAKLFYQQATDELIFVQGVVDLIFGDDSKLTLLDYKTDNCTAEQAVEKYKIQLQIYATAVEHILRRPVTERYLYLFHSGTIVPVEKLEKEVNTASSSQND